MSSTVGNSVPQDRCNCFTADPTLPADKQIFTSDYTNGGFDRGHMTRSADRTTANVENATTFYLTNVVPQQADLNQGVWAQFEDFARRFGREGPRRLHHHRSAVQQDARTHVREERGQGRDPRQHLENRLIGPRIGGMPFTLTDIQSLDDLAGLTVLAVNMPNVAGVRNDPWQKYLTTVDKIEAATGYDFLSLLQTWFQDALKRVIVRPSPASR